MKINPYALLGLFIISGSALLLRGVRQPHARATQNSSNSSLGAVEFMSDESYEMARDQTSSGWLSQKSEPRAESSAIPTHAIPKDLANNAEVIVISGYEPEERGASTKTRVTVDRPGQNVVLVLSSYEPVNWQISATATTQIKGIVWSSHDPGATIETPDSAQTYRTDLQFADALESPNFVQLLRELNTLFGIDRVSAYRGDYRLAQSITVAQPDPPNVNLTLAGPDVEPPPVDLPFKLYLSNLTAIPWTLAGPQGEIKHELVAARKFTASPDGTKIYEVKEDDLFYVTDLDTQKNKTFKLPKDFPEFSWIMDLAYDSRRDIVAVVTLGGEGHFYRFDADGEQWLDVQSMNDLDFFALTYDAADDRYLGIVDDWGGESDLVFLSPSGGILSSQLLFDVLPSYWRFQDLENSDLSGIDLFAKGPHVAVVKYDRDNFDPSATRKVQAIWHYDEQKNIGSLTYKAD